MSETSKQKDIEGALGLGKGARARRGVGRWVGILSILAALAGGGWWAMQAREAGSSGPSYRSEAATLGDITVTVTATGTVEPTNVVDISSELSGTLAEVLVDFNDSVAKGQVLARLDAQKLDAQVRLSEASVEASEAQVLSASATLSEATESYQTAKKLDARGVTSHQSLIEAKAVLDRALAQVQVANADRSVAEANLALARTERAKASIVSPIDGVVLDREADAGQIVAASLSAPVLFTVAEDLTEMEVQVAVDEADIGQLSQGNLAKFTVEAYDERVFEARITRLRFASETVDGVVTYSATLAVENPDLALRPGMTATAEIIVAEEKGRLLVPNAALRFAPAVEVEDSGSGSGGLLGMVMPSPPGNEQRAVASGRSVWVLKAGEAVEVAVQTGASDGSRTIVSGGDLKPGDLVITGQER
ncbi:MAG: efflux RND transporter periplasmic adaptor subunit [Paracoccaceae bacterium]